MTTIIIISPHPGNAPSVEVIGNDTGINNEALQQAVISQLQGPTGTDTTSSGEV